MVGRFRWGNLVRFVPYPVIAGFVAGTGWLILKGGASLMSDVALTWSSIPDLFEADVAVKWLPGVALAASVHLLLARYGQPAIVPAAIVVGSGAFCAVLYASGSSLAEAEAGGWLLGPFPSGSLLDAWLVLELLRVGRRLLELRQAERRDDTSDDPVQQARDQRIGAGSSVMVAISAPWAPATSCRKRM